MIRQIHTLDMFMTDSVRISGLSFSTAVCWAMNLRHSNGCADGAARDARTTVWGVSTPPWMLEGHRQKTQPCSINQLAKAGIYS